MKILLLEDLDNYAEVIIESLKKSKLRNVHIVRIATEFEFHGRLQELVNDSFDVGVFDVMVCWCKINEEGDPEAPNPPEEVLAEINQKAKWRSGLRCRRVFSEALEKAGKPAVPCIYYTILDRADLEDSLAHDPSLIIAKQGNIQPLVDGILKVVSSKP